MQKPAELSARGRSDGPDHRAETLGDRGGVRLGPHHDKDGVVARHASDDLGQTHRVDAGRDGVRKPRIGLHDDEVPGVVHPDDGLGQGAVELGRRDVALGGQGVAHLTVLSALFYEFEFADVARNGRLRDGEALLFQMGK